MKTLIAAALLLALTTPAFASSYATWDCGQDIEVTVGHYLQIGSGRNWPSKGAVSLKWDFQSKKPTVRVNGRKCLLLDNRMIQIKGCAQDSDYSCKELAENWEMTPDQIKHAVAEWRANWPGNTIRKPDPQPEPVMKNFKQLHGPSLPQ